MNTSITGLRAMVGGSTRGIGKAIAIGLAREGAWITLIGRDPGMLEKVRLEISEINGLANDVLIADFTHPESLQQALQHFLPQKPAYQILVNNTGGPAGGPIEMAETEQFRIAFNQHLICNHLLVGALKEGMKLSGYGRIINIISTSVKVPLHGLGVSNTIRGAVANWAKTMANELGKYNITVNNVLPGATRTDRLTSLVQAKSERTGTSVASLLEDMANEVPLRRIAEPDEIAAAAVFLASPAASYINGINLPVDGGRTGSL
jgi:3-oxoacyl-[acyl-carrier protein] reductase